MSCNSHNRAPTKTISAYLVAEDDLASYFKVHFGAVHRFAPAMFQEWMTRLCSGSGTSGAWTPYELSNGGFYLVPLSRPQYRMESPNGCLETVSADAAGIVVSMFVINHLANATDNDYLSDAYHALRIYGAEHREASSILGLTD